VCYPGRVSRIGLVLGAGGVVGHAFHLGVLHALAETAEWDAREADVIAGTSAGSVVAALVRAGFSSEDLYADMCGHEVSADGARLALAREHEIGPIPRRHEVERNRRPSVPSRSMLSRLVRGQVRASALAAAFMPIGSVPSEYVTAGFRPLFSDGWPAETLWISALNLDDGRRVTFGRDGAPDVDVPTAIGASCAIPTFFKPVEIEGARYVDGGMHSPTNADVLVDEQEPFDLVVISSPMSIAGRNVRFSPGEPMRRVARLALAREVARLRRAGTRVLAFQATVADAEEMGRNAMDPERRAPVARHAYASAQRRLHRADARDACEMLMKARRDR
jgi:NTE family protein